MTTTTPDLFPEAGQRGLFPKETIQRTSAMACTMTKDNKPSCFYLQIVITSAPRIMMMEIP